MKARTPSILIAAWALPLVALAHGDFKCEEPKTTWQPQMELQRKLLADGWKKVRQVKTTNGCPGSSVAIVSAFMASGPPP